MASGPAREVLWSRAVLPLSDALGLENVLEATVTARSDERGESRVTTSGDTTLVVPWPIDVGERISLGIPANEILLATTAPERISARNVLEARITALEETPDGVLVHLDAGDRLVAKITRAARDALSLAPESRVHLVVKSQALRRLA